MKLLVDMDLSLRWIGLLRNAGWEAVHWSAVGKVNAPDLEIMAYAAQHDHVVLTHDLDFSAILAATHGEKPICNRSKVWVCGFVAERAGF
ncbi:MAG: DUF5615 family PIN-like protein [Acidobacteriia bacterium]|nr:DUF5615 family PIN-like protein [Terriglobia bacterium]